MNPVIGIISYFPNDNREIRKNKLKELLIKCNEIFNIPIYVEAQNWIEEDYNDLFIHSNLTIHHNENPLGITGARAKLREWFLTSNYDYLIMLDDDCQLVGTKEDGELYLKQIESHPNMYGTFKGTLLKLFAISKEMYSKVEFPSHLEACNGDIFEDIYIVGVLRKKYPNQEFSFRHSGLKEESDSAWDINSTWFHYQYNKTEIGDKTRALLKEV